MPTTPNTSSIIPPAMSQSIFWELSTPVTGISGGLVSTGGGGSVAGGRVAVAVGVSEDEAFWQEFLRSLVRRGLKGVQLVISDAHEGLKAAISQVLTGASWQRCRVHFMRNVLSHVPQCQDRGRLSTDHRCRMSPDHRRECPLPTR